MAYGHFWTVKDLNSPQTCVAEVSSAILVEVTSASFGYRYADTDQQARSRYRQKPRIRRISREPIGGSYCHNSDYDH
jgi:hypothetical protein